LPWPGNGQIVQHMLRTYARKIPLWIYLLNFISSPFLRTYDEINLSRNFNCQLNLQLKSRSLVYITTIFTVLEFTAKVWSNKYDSSEPLNYSWSELYRILSIAKRRKTIYELTIDSVWSGRDSSDSANLPERRSLKGDICLIRVLMKVLDERNRTVHNSCSSIIYHDA